MIRRSWLLLCDAFVFAVSIVSAAPVPIGPAAMALMAAPMILPMIPGMPGSGPSGNDQNQITNGNTDASTKINNHMVANNQKFGINVAAPPSNSGAAVATNNFFSGATPKAPQSPMPQAPLTSQRATASSRPQNRATQNRATQFQRGHHLSRAGLAA